MRRITPMALRQHPNRQFLFWILTGLVAATVGTGVTALTMAVMMAGTH